MENTSPLILEISSDEEAGFLDTSRFGDKEDYGWLLELLEDDSDNVDLVGSEGVINPPNTPKLQSSEPFSKAFVNECGGDDDNDDDCVVLDGNPEKPVLVGNGKAATDDDDDDDLEIVGEKGEVACRDFPHSRHLCVKFPVASNPHVVHCNQCHCYVCDSLAPCAHWGTGSSSTDHCHASDKEEYWKAARRSRQKGDKPVQFVPTITDFVAGPHQATHVLPLAPPQPNYMLQNQILRPVTMRPCSISSNVIVPNVVNQSRSHPPGCPPRYISQLQLVSPQFHHPRNSNITSRVRISNAGNRSSQSFPPRAVFKRTGFPGAPPNNRHGYVRSYNGSQSCRHIQTPGSKGFRGSNLLLPNIGTHMTNSMFSQQNVSAPPSMDVRCANYIPSQPQTYSGPISSSLIRGPVTTQPQVPSPLYPSGNFVNTVPFQPQVASQPSVGSFETMFFPQPSLVFQPNCSVPSHNLASQSHIGSSFGNQLQSNSIFSSQLNMGSFYENQSSQPPAYDNTSSILINSQNDFQQETQSGPATTSVDFGFDFSGSLSHVNSQDLAEISQLQSAAPADNSQSRSILEDNHDHSIAPVGNSHQQTVALLCKFHQKNVAQADNSSSLLNDTDRHSPGTMDPDILGFQCDSWMFETQPSPGAFEATISPYWNTYSPEPASIDSGTLFDI